jgi:hypothetical protein
LLTFPYFNTQEQGKNRENRAFLQGVALRPITCDHRNSSTFRYSVNEKQRKRTGKKFRGTGKPFPKTGKGIKPPSKNPQPYIFNFLAEKLSGFAYFCKNNFPLNDLLLDAK